MDRHGAGVQKLDRRGVEAGTDAQRRLEDGNGPRSRPAPLLARAVAMPRAMQPEVGVERQPAGKIDEQVFAAGSDRNHVAPHDPIQCGTTRATAGVDDRLTGHCLTEHMRDARQRVAFRHVMLPT
jgi:hypothetical protein